MVQTTIVTRQGVAALSSLSKGIFGRGSYDYTGLDGIFFPLAILGLLRICAAPWLTEDFLYDAWRQPSSSWAQHTEL